MLRKKSLPACVMFLIGVFTTNTALCQQRLPIKPVRTISFTTNEGSYMDVNISPDGKMIVFTLLGDIYTMPSVGGVSRQLTRGLALHEHPVWSPDSKKIAYISDETGSPQLHVLDLNTFSTLLLNKSCTYNSDEAHVYKKDPLWDVNCQYIYFNGSMFALSGKEITTPLTIPDPLLFSTDKKIGYGIDSGKLFRYDLTAKTSIVISPDLGDFGIGKVSPDGHWWCYITNKDQNRCLIAENIVDGRKKVLIRSLILIDPRYHDETGIDKRTAAFSFNPDSKSIFISYGGKIHNINIENGQDRIIPFTAEVHVDLGKYNYHKTPVDFNPFQVKFCRSASESPDGKYLVFQALSKIYIMDLPKGKPHVFVPQICGQFQPAWSPDSKWIAYTTWIDTLGGALWKAPVTGGPPVQLTPIFWQYQHPNWSPDGKQIAVIKGPRKLNDSRVGLIVGGELELLSSTGNSPDFFVDSVFVESNGIAYSTDGKNMIYSPLNKEKQLLTEHQNVLISKNVETKSITSILESDEITDGERKVLSPDGKYLVYTGDHQLYLLPLTTFTIPAKLAYQSDNGPILSGIRFASGVDPHWENKGKMLAWTYGNKFYKINPARIIEAAEKQAVLQNLRDTIPGAPVTVNIAPDVTIPLSVTAAGAHAEGLLALKNVRILAMIGDRVIGRGTILIKDGRIVAVGPVEKILIPKSSRILDLQGTTVMPGLIDLHLHMSKGPADIFSQQSWNFLAALAYGVTTARDPSMSFDSYGYAEQLRSGQMIGPRLFTVGNSVRYTDGILRMDNQQDADKAIEERALLGGTEIKQYTLPFRIQREWLVLACEKQGMNMTNEGYYDPIRQLGEIKDGSTGIEHNPVFEDVYQDVIKLRAKAQTYTTATLQVCYGAEGALPYFDHKYWRYPDQKYKHFVYESQPEESPAKYINDRLVINFEPRDTINPGYLAPSKVDARLRHAGVNITMGSHGNDQGIGPHNEIWALQSGGLTNMEALQAATINGAKALGIQNDIGSIEVGKIADLIILNKNPLEDIHNTREIRYVMKGGIMYDANNLDEIWPAKKKCPEWKLKP